MSAFSVDIVFGLHEVTFLKFVVEVVIYVGIGFDMEPWYNHLTLMLIFGVTIWHQP